MSQYGRNIIDLSKFNNSDLKRKVESQTDNTEKETSYIDRLRLSEASSYLEPKKTQAPSIFSRSN